MKKLIALSLILAVLLPAAALAFDRELDTDYGYAHMEIAKDGSPFMAVIYFAEDQTCYYLAQMFRQDEPGLGRAYVGIWGYTSDGSIFAKVGENTTRTFKISSLGGLVDMDTMEVFESFSTLMK